MVDLTKITTPYGLLDAETQEALRSTGYSSETIESYTAYGRWEQNDDPSWHRHIVYRVKPQPPKPREWWANVYNTGPGNLHTTRAKADEVGGGRIECIRVREVL